MDIKRGDIYYIEASKYRPEIGSMQGSNRPAIIVSNAMNNKHSPTFEIVYLTAAPKKDLPTHCTIRSVRRVSTALCEQITTISGEQIGEYIGKCTKAEMDAVDMCMAISLGIDPQPAPAPNDDSAASKIADLEAQLKEAYAMIEGLQVPMIEGEALEDMLAELRMELERSRAREALLRELLQEAHK